jgi:hypothetical protein
MINDRSRLSSQDAFSRASDNLSLSQKYKILESLYHEARMMGHFTMDDLLNGIEADIHLAAVLNKNVSGPTLKDR